MAVVEDAPGVAPGTVPDRPLSCFLATTGGGSPRVSPLWFLREDGAVRVVGDRHKTYPGRVDRTPEAALAVVDFGRTRGTVQHVGTRGRATVEPLDPATVVARDQS